MIWIDPLTCYCGEKAILKLHLHCIEEAKPSRLKTESWARGFCEKHAVIAVQLQHILEQLGHKSNPDTVRTFLEEFCLNLQQRNLTSFKFNPKENDESRTFSGKLERR